MNSIVLDDARAVPNLFLWNGPVDRRKIDDWITNRGWVIPDDLRRFWTVTGGGETFESEKFLQPLVSADVDDSVAQVTAWCEERGMPHGFVVFHEGFSFTAIRQLDGAYVSLDRDLRVTGEYGTLDRWYVKVLRAEYGQRYGLARLS